MSNYTENLGLFKYDKSTNGEEKFSIQKALNDNWDKIDAASKKNQFLSHNAQVYSKEEICIGAYLGKPLYRKCIDVVIPPGTGQQGAWTKHNISNIGDVIHLEFMWYDTTDSVWHNRFRSAVQNKYNIGDEGVSVSDTHILISNSMSNTIDWSTRISKAFVILEYTKTSDPEGSAIVSNPKKYSLEEQVVGEWYNGKPIYRKCFTGVAPANINETITLLDITDCNIDTPICIEGMVGINGGAIPLNFYFSSQSSVSTWFSRNTIQFMIMDSNLVNLPINGYIEYTKTTDVAVES